MKAPHKVTVYHKHTGEARTMSGLAWTRLKRSQENNWEEITDPDYLAGKAKEAEAKAAPVQNNVQEDEPREHWKAVVAAIENAETLSEVEELTKGDDRKSVVKAKKQRIEELT